jgi:LmbE family N-acetylglucosaminyl deacetylase
MKTIMIVGSHPDDIELGMGGSIRKFADEGNIIIWVELTIGSYTDRSGKPVRTIEEVMGTKAKLQAMYGFKIYQNLFQETTKAEINKEVISTLQDLIIDHHVDEIYTHPEIDTYHQDHRICHQIVMAAARKYVHNIYCFESIFNICEGIIHPLLYIEISREQLDIKLQSLTLHKTEYEKFGTGKWLDNVETLSKMRGVQAGCLYAEAFQVLKERR